MILNLAPRRRAASASARISLAWATSRRQRSRSSAYSQVGRVSATLEKVETLSSEAYWSSLELSVPNARGALERLIEAVDPLGVYPEVLGSLNLKWARPAGVNPVNLATSPRQAHFGRMPQRGRPRKSWLGSMQKRLPRSAVTCARCRRAANGRHREATADKGGARSPPSVDSRHAAPHQGNLPS